MPVFAYRGFTASGRAAHGLLDADSPRAAWQTLRARGLYPTAIADGDGDGAARAGPGRLAELCERLAALLGAGLPLTDALAAAGELADAATARILTRVAARVREGSTLAEALAVAPRTFPPLARALVRAGESSGDLAGALARLGEHAAATAARRRRLAAALTYPAIVAATTLAVLAFLVVWVLPQVAALVAQAEGTLPMSTRIVLALAAGARRSGWLLLVLALAGGAWLVRARAAAGPRALRLARRLPGIGPLVRDAAAARVAHVLGTVLGAGMPLDAAMTLAVDASGPVLAPVVRQVDARVRDGEALSRALERSGALPPLLVRLVGVGERTGTLSASLLRAATLLEAGVSQRLDRALALVEPALVLGAGAVVLAVVSAVLLPLLGLDPVGPR